MSSTVSVTPIAVDIRPSRRLACYVLGVYAASCLVIFILPISQLAVSIALIVLLLLGTVTYHTRVSLRSPRAVVALNRHADGAWQLRLSSGDSYQARILPDSYVHPDLLVLNFRLSRGKRCSVVLLRDSADTACLRRLRAGLSLGVRESKV